MANTPRIEFGYWSPTGGREQEAIRRPYFISDLEHTLDVAAQGFKSIWFADHVTMADDYLMECSTLLTWVAARYPGVKVGGLVMCNSFRHPALLAKMGASLQAISSGRFILGYGAGWHEPEYKAYGYDFPRPRVRIEMMEEGIQVIKALWTQSPASFSGKYYQVDNAYCEPRPDPVPPIMVGGSGRKFTLRVVVRHADWWNAHYKTVDELREVLDVLGEHCETEGRDFQSIRKVFNSRIFIDRSHSTALKTAEERRDRVPHSIAGDPSAVRDELTMLAEKLGMGTFIATFSSPPETEDMRLFIDEVIPAFA